MHRNSQEDPQKHSHIKIFGITTTHSNKYTPRARLKDEREDAASQRGEERRKTTKGKGEKRDGVSGSVRVTGTEEMD